MKLGHVRAFPGATPDKEQVLKPLEEAAEVFGAWQMLESTRANLHAMLDDHGCDEVNADEVVACMDDANYCMVRISDELADTITACCNLAAALGVTDLTPYLARCEERNRERGRYDG